MFIYSSLYSRTKGNLPSAHIGRLCVFILAIVQGRAALSEYEPQDDTDSLAQANEAVALDMINNAGIDQFECESEQSEESDDDNGF